MYFVCAWQQCKVRDFLHIDVIELNLWKRRYYFQEVKKKAAEKKLSSAKKMICSICQDIIVCIEKDVKDLLVYNVLHCILEYVQ